MLGLEVQEGPMVIVTGSQECVLGSMPEKGLGW